MGDLWTTDKTGSKRFVGIADEGFNDVFWTIPGNGRVV